MNEKISGDSNSGAAPTAGGSPPKPKKFRVRFCEEYNCTREEYVKKVFSIALYSHARIPAFFLRIFYPSYFKIDREYILEAGETEHPAMFRGEIDIYYGNNLRSRSWLRNKMLIRLSGTKMKRIGERLFKTKLR